MTFTSPPSSTQTALSTRKQPTVSGARTARLSAATPASVATSTVRLHGRFSREIMLTLSQRQLAIQVGSNRRSIYQPLFGDIQRCRSWRLSREPRYQGPSRCPKGFARNPSLPRRTVRSPHQICSHTNTKYIIAPTVNTSSGRTDMTAASAQKMMHSTAPSPQVLNPPSALFQALPILLGLVALPCMLPPALPQIIQTSKATQPSLTLMS